jgi:hypothetical protein
VGTVNRWRGIQVSLGKRNQMPREYIPYQNNDNVYVEYELAFKGDVLKPGDKFKIKFDRDVYIFLRLAHHIKNDTTWVDAMSDSRGSWHSIRIETIQKIIRPKKLRKKKVKPVDE